MSEANFKNALVAKLKAAYPAAFFFRPGANAFAMAGIPDICGVVYGRFVGIEAKKPGKYATPLKGCTLAQLKIGTLIMNAGGIWIATDDIDDCLTTLRHALQCCGALPKDIEVRSISGEGTMRVQRWRQGRLTEEHIPVTGSTLDEQASC